MTKNGSNARKARIRAHATKTGTSYRQAAREMEAERAQEQDDRAAQKAQLRAAIHNPEDLAEERTRYLGHMLAVDLPDSVRVCLFVLADRLGTGKLTDRQGVSFTIPELSSATGLTYAAVEDSVNLARAHGWITGEPPGHVHLSIPGENIEMYEWFLKQVKQPVRDVERHSGVLERIDQERSHQVQEAEEARAIAEQFWAAHSQKATLLAE
ncbi:hypothetical protein GCM10012285_60150 [Streptomyces kronopolitis]|uniref:Uncharacterized protein n=1 Tax=Streptomyces kronopolitis TaxID=1612435 RepID=A0ABQ2K0C3_9ACTN|nr:hypothetical protein [Streptomyces kronopolitis]GGN61350.1 hypothetical protein GCM10012285_60150 [Streptomyces kronopolitis]